MGKASPTVALDPITQSNYETWIKIKDDLARIQALEMQYRLALIDSGFFDRSKTEGSESIKLPDGSRLSVSKPINYSVAKDKPTVNAAVAALFAVNPGAAAAVIDWKPELSVSAYKALTPDERLLIAPIISSKPGTPQLERTPAKEQTA